MRKYWYRRRRTVGQAAWHLPAKLFTSSKAPHWLRCHTLPIFSEDSFTVILLLNYPADWSPRSKLSNEPWKFQVGTNLGDPELLQRNWFQFVFTDSKFYRLCKTASTSDSRRPALLGSVLKNFWNSESECHPGDGQKSNRSNFDDVLMLTRLMLLIGCFCKEFFSLPNCWTGKVVQLSWTISFEIRPILARNPSSRGCRKKLASFLSECFQDEILLQTSNHLSLDSKSIRASEIAVPVRISRL